jgi:hypothetical protein
MKQGRYGEEQIIAVLKKAEAGSEGRGNELGNCSHRPASKPNARRRRAWRGCLGPET